MKTVALITTRLVRQGPNKQLLYLIRNIDKSKISPIIITLSPEKDPSLLKDFQKEDVSIIQLNLGFFKSLFHAKKQIEKIVDDYNIDILHSFSYAIRAEFVIYKAKRVKKIASIRNSPKESSKGYNGSILGPILYRLKMDMYKHFDILVACSKSILQLPELSGFNKIAIQNGIDIKTKHNKQHHIEKSTLRKNLNIPLTKPIFITISNGTSIKNIEFLIEFFKTKDAVLIIAGDSIESYVDLAKQNTNFIFTGHIDNIVDYYRAADFFISSSYLEGLPNAVLEALWAGTPCILSDIAMHKEIINASTVTIGTIFKNNSKEELQEKIDMLTKQVNENTSQDCSNFVKEHFSAERMAKEYQKLYLSF